MRRLLETTVVLVALADLSFPDYMVFGSDVLAKGDAGVRAAGWFDHAWRLRP